jgi:hypothetical protein
LLGNEAVNPPGIVGSGDFYGVLPEAIYNEVRTVQWRKCGQWSHFRWRSSVVRKYQCPLSDLWTPVTKLYKCLINSIIKSKIRYY